MTCYHCGCPIEGPKFVSTRFIAGEQRYIHAALGDCIMALAELIAALAARVRYLEPPEDD